MQFPDIPHDLYSQYRQIQRIALALALGELGCGKCSKLDQRVLVRVGSFDLQVDAHGNKVDKGCCLVDAWRCSVNIDTAFEKVTGFGGKVEANSQIDTFVEVTEVVFGAGRAQGSWFDLDRSPRLNELDEWRRMATNGTWKTYMSRISSLVSCFV